MWQKARLYESAALAVGAAVLFLTVAVAVHPRPGVLGDARASPMNARKVMLGMSTIKERGGVHSLGQEEEGDWTSDVSSFLASVDIPDAASLKELIVEYGHRQVQGQTLSVEAEGDGLSAEPLVAWDQTVGSDLQHLTLVMIDPDAPSREGDGSAPGSSGPWLHALWSNCAGGSTTSCDQPMTVEYEPPTPPAGTGKHRYIFLLFKQDGSIDVDHLETTRAKWDVKGFVKANDLEPLALNFFYATP